MVCFLVENLLCLLTQSHAKNVYFVKVLARAREQGEGEECGGLEEGDSGESSEEEEDIVTDFPINNGNSVLGEVIAGHGFWSLSSLHRSVHDMIRCRGDHLEQ